MDGCSCATLRLLASRVCSSFHLIEAAEDRAEDGVRNDHGYRRADTVVHGHEARRLEHAMRLRAVLLAGHTRVHAWQYRHDSNENEERMERSDDRAAPPSRGAERLKDQDIDQREQPAEGDVNQQAPELGAFAI